MKELEDDDKLDHNQLRQFSQLKARPSAYLLNPNPSPNPNPLTLTLARTLKT